MGRLVLTTGEKQMALNLGNGGNNRGDILPIFKWDARSGDMVAVNRDPQSDGTWEKTEVEVQWPLRCVVDLENIEVGWVHFNPAPDFVMAKADETRPAKPTPDYKQCVRMRVFSKDYGLREFAHSAGSVRRAMDKLHDAFCADRASHPGKMPVVEITGYDTVKVKTPEGELKFKAPKWSIVGWTLAPEAFVRQQVEAAPPAPPVVKAASKAPPAADADEF
jgi:hypothetical protein